MTFLDYVADYRWRLENLWSIQDKWARTQHFKGNSSQLWFRGNRWLFTILTKSRQHGFSTEESIQCADTCIFHENQKVGLIDNTIRDAKEKLSKVRFAWETMGLNVPGWELHKRQDFNAFLKETFPLVSNNQEALEWGNGSKFSCSTTYRGGTLQRLWCSEFGYISMHRPRDAEEIMSGAVEAVAAGNWALLEFTWEGGKSGEAWRLTKEAMKTVGAKERLPKQWKFLFIPFLENPDNVLNVQRYDFQPEEEKEFKKWEEAGIHATLQQKAFWADRYRNMPEFAVFKHYPALVTDMFRAPTKGAIYAEILMQREAKGHVCQFDVDDQWPSYVSMDLGGSNTTMWHTQITPTEVILLNYYQAPAPVNLGECIRTIEHWNSECPVHRIFLPHDAEGTNSSGSNFKKDFLKAGAKGVLVVPQCRSVWQGIGELKSMFKIARFHRRLQDQTAVKIGEKEFTAWDLLTGYRVEQVPEGSTIPDQPKKDFTAHCADGLRCLAEARMHGMLGYAHGQPERRRHEPRQAILIR